jgi:hypothetical protein
MKTLKRLFFSAIVIPSLAFLYSCENKGFYQEEKGSAEFSVSLPAQNDAKSGAEADSSVISYHILTSVENLQGSVVFTDSLIPLYTFGSDFVSENIKLNAGEYKLTKFMVINSAGTVVYAAPVAGSPLAYLTMRPLPFNFNIFPNQVTKVLPEVLTIGDNTPDKFGYAAFGMSVIHPLDFWAVCYLETPAAVSAVLLTDARLSISTPMGWFYSCRLAASLNHLIIRGGSDIYNFVLEKDGYQHQKMQFTAKQLLAATKENPLVFKIPAASQYKIIVIQPGPEKGKDAMISNLEPEKNFGAHKYFEATFLSESVLTVMRSNRSLIFFNLDTIPKSAIIKKVILTLSYDLPIPFDSTFLTNTNPATAGINWYGAVLQQVVAPWEENKVTWSTQPKTIEANQVYIMPFIRNVNFIDIDITRLIVPMAEIATPNCGMMLRLWPTEKFPGFRFASSDFPEPKMRPRLTIYYTIN